jgi:glutathione S-transferase
MIRVRMVPASPFARKCRIAAAHLGLSDRVSFVDGPDDPDDALRARNPLTKIPIALLEDGSTLYDILEFFDHLAGGGRIIPQDSRKRFRTLATQALADGIMDAAVMLGYETRFREAHERSPKWIEMQKGKIARGLNAAENMPLEPGVDVGSIALACALGFLDLRHDGEWRAGLPRLVAFLERFAEDVPAFEATRALR